MINQILPEDVTEQLGTSWVSHHISVMMSFNTYPLYLWMLYTVAHKYSHCYVIFISQSLPDDSIWWLGASQIKQHTHCHDNDEWTWNLPTDVENSMWST